LGAESFPLLRQGAGELDGFSIELSWLRHTFFGIFPPFLLLTVSFGRPRRSFGYACEVL
jgi:hypothetical protein